MGVISWLVVGWMVGSVARTLSGLEDGEGPAPYTLLGVVGGLMGGLTGAFIGGGNYLTDLPLPAIPLALAGGGSLILAWRIAARILGQLR